MIYQGVKVNGNAEGCAKLISTGVTLANGLAGSVSFVGYAGIREKLLDSSNACSGDRFYTTRDYFYSDYSGCCEP